MTLRQEPCKPWEVTEYFSSLGAALQEAWHGTEYDEERFAHLAHEALAAAPPAERLRYTDIIDWLACAEALPQQAKLDEAFGQPPVTLFWNGRFQIDVLFWHTATTAIHQHAFSGAFAVLGGSSVHCRYQFEVRRKLNSRFLLGAIRLHDVELLEVGAMRRIERGSGLVHSLFHLDTPSVTVVVRTCEDPETGPEYVYYPPSVALDPSRTDALRTKQVQMLDLLLRMRSADLERFATRILSRCDLHTAFLVLVRLGAAPWAAEVYDHLLGLVRQRYGEWIEALVPAIEEERRRALIFELRRSVFDPTHRFFLALLLNLPDRSSIDMLISSRFPGSDPAVLIEQWIADLAQTGALGMALDAVLLRLLRGCLQGLRAADIVRELKTDYPPDQVDGQATAVEEACRRIVANPILQPLFRPASAAGAHC